MQRCLFLKNTMVSTRNTTYYSSLTVLSSLGIQLPTGLILPISSHVLDYLSINGTRNFSTPIDPFEQDVINYDNTYGGVFNTSVIDFQVIDDLARQMNFNLSRFIARYNCRDFYPFHNCSYCSDAYKSWSCGILFPTWDPESLQTLPMCNQVCYNVIQKCPVELQFDCPEDPSYYARYPNCNPVNLLIESGANKTGLFWLVLLSLIVVQIIMIV